MTILTLPIVSLEQDTLLPESTGLLPRKRWLRPNMTEKLLTGTLSLNTTNQPIVSQWKLKIAIANKEQIKNISFVEANVLNISAKFQLYPPYNDFWIFFSEDKTKMIYFVDISVKKKRWKYLQ